jgi:hypothetical protein
MTTEELIAYYQNLLIVQFYDKPKAKAEVGVWTAQAIADQIIYTVLNAFDLDTAVGEQLTILGKYVGAPRIVNGLDLSKEFMALPEYADPDKDTYQGLYEYVDYPIENLLQQYIDTGSRYQLTDDELRQLIYFKIRVNKWDGTLADADDILNEIFEGDCLLTDGMDMTITYAFTPSMVSKLPAIVTYLNLLPKPTGVEIIVTGV